MEPIIVDSIVAAHLRALRAGGQTRFAVGIVDQTARSTRRRIRSRDRGRSDYEPGVAERLVDRSATMCRSTLSAWRSTWLMTEPYRRIWKRLRADWPSTSWVILCL